MTKRASFFDEWAFVPKRTKSGMKIAKVKATSLRTSKKPSDRSVSDPTLLTELEKAFSAAVKSAHAENRRLKK